ncbi:MAG: hypothetical protein ACLPJH_04100 [Myxococcaceae bacterium]
MDPVSVGGTVLKALGALWNAISSPFERWRFGEAFERYKVFVRECPTRVTGQPRIPNNYWTPETYRIGRVGVQLGHLEVRPTSVYELPDHDGSPGHFRGTYGYCRIHEQFHFPVWLAEDRRQREIERDSAVPPPKMF